MFSFGDRNSGEAVPVLRPLWRWRWSARRAARRDLASPGALACPTPFQRHVRSAYRAARRVLLAGHVRQAGRLTERLAEIARRILYRQTDRDSAGTAIRATEGKLEALPAPRRRGRLGPVAYFGLLFLFALFEWPVLQMSLTRMALSDPEIDLLALLFGVASMAFVHVGGCAAAHCVPHEGEEVEARRDWLLHVTVLAFSAVALVGMVVAFGVVRGGELEALSRLVGRAGLDPAPLDALGDRVEVVGISSPRFFAAAFAFFHFLVLVAAFFLAYWRAQGSEWRELRRQLAAAEAELKRAQRALEELESERDRLEEQLAALDEETRHRLRELRHVHELVEAEYLAVLARARPAHPQPLSDWDEVEADAGEPVTAASAAGAERARAARIPQAALEQLTGDGRAR